MPIRLIRDGILTSERVASLSWEAEVFYRRLLSLVDDYGLADARPSVLRSALYPLQLEKMSECNIQRCLAACEKAGLILLFTRNGKSFLMVRNFGQSLRSAPKCPLPDGYKAIQTGKSRYQLVTPDDDCLKLQADENNCEQLFTNANAYSNAYSNAKEHNSVPIRSTVVSGADGVRDGSLASSQQQVEQFPADADEVQRFMAGMVEVPGGEELERYAAGFYDDFAARGWRDSRGIPLADWRPAARKYARTWAVNNVQQTGSRGVMTGSRRKDANEGRRYA